MSLTRDPGRDELQEMVYRLDGPLRWALGEASVLLQGAGPLWGATALDVGAGTGYLSLPLAAAVGPDGRVHCLDREPQLLSRLSEKAVRAGLWERLLLRKGGATELPYPDGRFDLVVSSYLLHELGEAAPAALAEMRRVLRPMGALAVADYRRIPDPDRCREIEAWYGAQRDGAEPGEVHLRFDLGELEVMFRQAGFADVELSTWLEFHVHIRARK